jgi:hypothetical protein
MREWLASGNPFCYWISGFFFPQGNLRKKHNYSIYSENLDIKFIFIYLFD